MKLLYLVLNYAAEEQKRLPYDSFGKCNRAFSCTQRYVVYLDRLVCACQMTLRDTGVICIFVHVHGREL